jgi:hypothetical protein
LGEHLTQKHIEDYCQQRLAIVDLLSVSDHLGECEICQQQVEYAMDGNAAFFALRSEVFNEATEISLSPKVRTHLTVEQTSAYVDKHLTDEELQVVVDHLTNCEFCALAVDDLHTFKNEIASSLEREYHPVPVSPQTENWWQRTIAALPALFQRSPGLAFGAVLAILLLAVVSWLVWRTPEGKAPKQEIVEAPPVSPSLPSIPSQQVSVPVPVVAQLNDGEGQLALDKEGKLSGADNLPPAYQNMLKEALTTRRIEKSAQLKGLVRPPSALMSTDKDKIEFSLIEPVGKVLMSNRPTFRWSSMEGATGYTVEIFDSKFNLVAASPQLTGNSWVASQSLPYGKVFAWQVKATKDGQEFTSPRPPAPQASFRILDQAKANELAKARRTYASSHLTLGLLYADAGLLKEAEQELRVLQKANPDSEIARSLLRQVQALKR